MECLQGYGSDSQESSDSRRAADAADATSKRSLTEKSPTDDQLQDDTHRKRRRVAAGVVVKDLWASCCQAQHLILDLRSGRI